MTVDGAVAFGGSFNGSPVVLAVRTSTPLGVLHPRTAERRSNRLTAWAKPSCGALKKPRRRHGVPLLVSGFGTAFAVHFTQRAELHEYRDTFEDDPALVEGAWCWPCLRRVFNILPDAGCTPR